MSSSEATVDEDGIELDAGGIACLTAALTRCPAAEGRGAAGWTAAEAAGTIGAGRCNEAMGAQQN
eukprot:8170919-Pyramimonas_sp.AAC.1